jgi:hypothetical protein
MNDPLFRAHKLNETGLANANLITNAFNELLDKITPLCLLSGRELALVRTKLEEASFFAKKAMAIDPANQA